MRLLVTRPEPDNERTAAALRAHGHEVVLAPLIRIEAVAGADFGAPPFAGILLTSANAARAIAAHRRRGELLALPVLAVGRSSADAARAAGFADVTSADGDGGNLAGLASARFAGVRQPLLYLAGEDRARDLAGALAEAGLSVRTVAVYRAAKATAFPSAVRAALEQGGINGVLHFSRRSVESYVECGRELGGRAWAPVHYCLSARTAEPLRQAGAARIRVAPTPDEASLLALVTPQTQPNRLEC
jgi:uroporphyrinogen-III synthase